MDTLPSASLNSTAASSVDMRDQCGGWVCRVGDRGVCASTNRRNDADLLLMRRCCHERCRRLRAAGAGATKSVAAAATAAAASNPYTPTLLDDALAGAGAGAARSSAAGEWNDTVLDAGRRSPPAPDGGAGDNPSGGADGDVGRESWSSNNTWWVPSSNAVTRAAAPAEGSVGLWESSSTPPAPSNWTYAPEGGAAGWCTPPLEWAVLTLVGDGFGCTSSAGSPAADPECNDGGGERAPAGDRLARWPLPRTAAPAPAALPVSAPGAAVPSVARLRERCGSAPRGRPELATGTCGGSWECRSPRW